LISTINSWPGEAVAAAAAARVVYFAVGVGGEGKWSCKQSARTPLLFLPSRNPSWQQPERELGSRLGNAQ